MGSGYGVSSGDDKNVLELDTCGGCTVDLRYFWRQSWQVLDHVLGGDTERRAKFGAGAGVG